MEGEGGLEEEEDEYVMCSDPRKEIDYEVNQRYFI
jgi:hypothetical protein